MKKKIIKKYPNEVGKKLALFCLRFQTSEVILTHFLFLNDPWCKYKK